MYRYIHDYQVFEWEGMNDWSIMHKGTLVAEIKTPEKSMFIGTTHGVWGFDDKDNSEENVSDHVPLVVKFEI